LIPAGGKVAGDTLDHSIKLNLFNKLLFTCLFYYLKLSPAGGCLLAMSCDYRVMVKNKFTIGLNETKLGIVAPFWFKAR
jgi:hypothetical protein